MDKIIIKDLEVNCIIGMLDFERVNEQRLHVSMVLYKDLSVCAKSGDLSDSVNYAQVCQSTELFIKERKELLLEKLAYDLANYILDNFNLRKIKIKLVKPDIIKNTKGVGISIKLKR